MPVPVAPVDVEISIVSLGNTRQLAACVGTLPAACEGLSWRLAIVDNSAAGRDLQAVADGTPSLRVYRSEGRRGFGANHNLVLGDVVAEARARYVLVLNDDVELDERAVTALVGRAETDGTIAAISPHIRGAGGRPEPSQMRWPSVMHEVLRTAFPRRDPPWPHDGGWLNGACMLLRTSALRHVGLFDTAFFLFFEDTDLCRRLVDAGWRTEVCPTSSIVHHAHGTILAPELRPDVEEQVLRSRYLFFRKHHGLTAARAVTLLVRVVLLVRATKMLGEAVLGRRANGFSRPRTLWVLARSQPARPSRLEREANLQTTR